MEINWNEIDNKIKNLEYPYVMIFKFFNLLHFIDDDNAVKLLRLIIKNNLELFIDQPFFILCRYIPLDRYNKTVSFLIEFYDLLKNKINIVLQILKWKNIYNDKYFWDLETEEQISFINDLSQRIKANFDCSLGGMPLKYKLINLLKTNREDTIELLTERLRNIYLLMGKQFFRNAEIPVILRSDFVELSDEYIIKYSIMVYDKTIDLLNTTVAYLENFTMICLKMKNLLDPLEINIVID